MQDYVERFDPEELKSRFDKGLKRSGLLAGANKLKYWELYEESYPALTQREEGGPPQLFSEEFARAYRAGNGRARRPPAAASPRPLPRGCRLPDRRPGSRALQVRVSVGNPLCNDNDSHLEWPMTLDELKIGQAGTIIARPWRGPRGAAPDGAGPAGRFTRYRSPAGPSAAIPSRCRSWTTPCRCVARRPGRSRSSGAMNAPVGPGDRAEPPGTPVIAVIGNPNTGKSTLFNALTGLRQKTANYPGVTVERHTGDIMLDGQTVTLVDLPGAYSLAAQSPDEMVAIDVLLGHVEDLPRPRAVLAVVDATNLRRNLFLVTQLAELGLPMVIALNMSDLAAENRGIRIDIAELGAGTRSTGRAAVGGPGHRSG